MQSKSMRPVFLSLGLPFIQERLAFLRRTREVDGVMSLLLKPRDDVSNLRRIDDVHKLSIRPFGEDRDEHQHGLLPVHRTVRAAFLRSRRGSRSGPAIALAFKLFTRP